ncbi:MAG: M55 family metallopeptidase [Candidatus Solibacter usitatus]|nr:M55 family metallopeptidase [Candidatus Solibacter usitatus]
MTRTIRCAAVLLTACGICLAQGPRIAIITDMEGVGGVNNAEEQLLPGQRRFDESRKLLTGELNAAVAGAFRAGASEVVVWDGHDGSRSLSIDTIHPRAKLIQGRPTPSTYYFGDNLYDGLMWVGQHPMAGANGVLAHSQSFSVQQITLNGKPVGEIGQAAAIAGYYGIPAIMLSGDEAACEELRDLQPKAETVAVKKLVGKASTLSLSHEEAKRQIEAAAFRAVRRIKEFKPWKIDGPVELKFVFKPDPQKTPEGRTNIYKGATVLEAYQAWLGK